jgi:hypothetical protein
VTHHDPPPRPGANGGHLDSAREMGEWVMNTATTGLAAGMALGFAGYFGGFWAFLLVLVLGAAGLVVGLVLQGDLDLRARRQR